MQVIRLCVKNTDFYIYANHDIIISKLTMFDEIYCNSMQIYFSIIIL